MKRILLAILLVAVCVFGEAAAAKVSTDDIVKYANAFVDSVETEATLKQILMERVVENFGVDRNFASEAIDEYFAKKEVIFEAKKILKQLWVANIVYFEEFGKSPQTMKIGSDQSNWPKGFTLDPGIFSIQMYEFYIENNCGATARPVAEGYPFLRIDPDGNLTSE